MNTLPNAGRTRHIPQLYGFVLAAYLFGTAAFNRAFSRLHIDLEGLPLFTGEATLAILVALAIVLAIRSRRLPFALDLPNAGMLLYLLIGALFTGLGLSKGYGLPVLRDAALVYYAAFYFVAIAYASTGKSPANLLRALALGGVVGALVSAGRFFVAPELSHGHAAPSYVGLIAWSSALWLGMEWPRAKGGPRRAALILGILLCCFVVYLTGYKTMFGAAAASLALLWLWGLACRRGPVGQAKMQPALLVTSAALAVSIAGMGLARVLPDTEGPLATHGSVTLSHAFRVRATRWTGTIEMPGVLQAPTSGEDVSVAQEMAESSLSFRLDVWRKAVARIRSSPFLGIGFGPAPNLFPDDYCELAASPTSNCGNAHNTYLTIAMRMGIPVFLLLAILNLHIVARMGANMWRTRRVSGESDTPWLILAILASYAVFALFSLFLESPYLSSIYWTVLALAYLYGQEVSRVEPAPGVSQG